MNAAAPLPLHSSPQHLAATPYISCWLAASAGTGKTKTLVDRLLRLLLSGAQPPSILCLTYTKAAAGEMKERLLSRLKEWSTASDDTLPELLTTLIGESPTATQLTLAKTLFTQVMAPGQSLKIQTIHSFCQNLLQTFPLEAGLPPHFSILSDVDTALLQEQALHLALEDPLASKHLSALGLIVSDSYIKDLIQNFIAKRPQWEALLRYHGSLEDYITRLADYLAIREALPAYNTSQLSVCAEHLLASSGMSDQKLGGDLLSFIAEGKDITPLFLTQSGEPRKKLTSKAFGDSWPGDVELLSAMQQLAIRHRQQQNNRFIYTKTTHFLYAVSTLLTFYDSLKAQQNALDYTDLIRYALTLITKPGTAEWALYKLGSRIDHILVDEAQDTSPDQWALIQTLVDAFFTPDNTAHTLFVVGDIKQSIYSFQGAKPLLFHQLQSHFQEVIERSGGRWSQASMERSYRSSAAVLDVVDTLFNTNPQGVLWPEDNVKHTPHREGAAGRVALWPLVETVPEEGKPAPPPPWRIPNVRTPWNNEAVALAQNLCTRIVTLLETGDILPSTGQPITPQDILVLVEKRSAFIPHLVGMLHAQGLPVEATTSRTLQEQLPIMDLIALGRFLTLPLDDYSLACVLKSPLVHNGHGFDDRSLSTLCAGRPGTLWENLHRFTHIPGMSETLTFLEDLRARVDWQTPFNFFSYVMHKTRLGFVARFGQEVLTLLDRFLSACQTFEAQNPAQLESFLHYLTHNPLPYSHNGDSSLGIRIMTVHGSKGLQAPVVILADTTDTPKPHMDPFIWYDDQHVFFIRPSQSEETPQTAPLKDLHGQLVHFENRRLLYVALTRAQDQLYLTGLNRGKDASWYTLVDDALQQLGAAAHGPYARVYEPTPHTQGVPYTLQPKPHEIPAWFRPLTSHAEVPAATVQTAQTERGEAIHTLLECPPHVSPEVASHWLGVKLNTEDIMQAERLKGDPNLAYIFGSQSRSEVEIQTPEGLLRLDRLVVFEDEVHIIDFKTTPHPPQSLSGVPKAYQDQLICYGHALAPFYPHHKIRLFLLWTEGPYLMEISYSTPL